MTNPFNRPVPCTDTYVCVCEDTWAVDLRRDPIPWAREHHSSKTIPTCIHGAHAFPAESRDLPVPGSRSLARKSQAKTRPALTEVGGLQPQGQLFGFAISFTFSLLAVLHPFPLQPNKPSVGCHDPCLRVRTHRKPLPPRHLLAGSGSVHPNCKLWSSRTKQGCQRVACPSAAHASCALQ